MVVVLSKLTLDWQEQIKKIKKTINDKIKLTIDTTLLR